MFTTQWKQVEQWGKKFSSRLPRPKKTNSREQYALEREASIIIGLYFEPLIYEVVDALYTCSLPVS